MRYFRNGLEIVFGVLTVIFFSLFFAYAWPDKEYGLSGWMQAVGSILAILASGLIATAQARKQFEDARRLQRMDQAHQALRMAKASSAIAGRSVSILLKIIREFKWDRETFHGISERTIPFDSAFLDELRSDLDAIELHQLLSSRLIEKLMALRSATRQVVQKIEYAMSHHRSMDANQFAQMFAMLDNAHLQICVHVLDIDEVTDSIYVEYTKLKNGDMDAHI